MTDSGFGVLRQAIKVELPRQPRLAPWLSFVELGDGRLQLRAADFAFTIPDPLLADVVRHLRPLLDGSRPAEEIVASGGSAFLPGTITFMLRLLRQRGVLQEGLPPSGLDEDARRRFAPALRYLGHYVADPERVLSRLQVASVSVTGDPALCGRLSASLREIGIDRVAQDDPAATASDLLVALARGPAPSFFEGVNARCLASGARWMRVALEGHRALVGPTIVPAQTACYTCWVLRRSTYDTPAEFEASRRHAREVGATEEGEFAPLVDAMIAQTGLEIARLLSGFSPPVTFGREYVLDGASPRIVGHDVLRVPRCPSCARRQSPRDPWDLRGTAIEALR